MYIRLFCVQYNRVLLYYIYIILWKRRVCLPGRSRVADQYGNSVSCFVVVGVSQSVRFYLWFTMLPVIIRCRPLRACTSRCIPIHNIMYGVRGFYYNTHTTTTTTTTTIIIIKRKGTHTSALPIYIYIIYTRSHYHAYY